MNAVAKVAGKLVKQIEDPSQVISTKDQAVKYLNFLTKAVKKKQPFDVYSKLNIADNWTYMHQLIIVQNFGEKELFKISENSE